MIIKKVQLHAKTFKEMYNLRIIEFMDLDFLSVDRNVTFRAYLDSLPNSLRILHWMAFPQRSLPQDFCPENLVTLEMCYSHLEQLWEEDQVLSNLKRLNLSRSRKLKRLPDLSLCPNIEEIILSDCESLVEVYSFNFLDKLNWLCLDGCKKLERLDIHSNILSRSSGLVALHGCHNLKTLLINNRTNVVQLYGGPPFNLVISVCVFYDQILLFHGCLKWKELPEIKDTAENLEVVILDETAIKEQPSSLHCLVGLEELSLQRCTKLKTIPSSIGNLRKLLKLNLAYCVSLETFPSTIFKLNLTELDFQGCSMLKTFPEILEPVESFTHINLTKTAIKELPSSLHLLVGLEELSLQSCTKLKTIPSPSGNLSKLLKLNLADCVSLETFPSSIFKLKLTKLDFEDLPSSIEYLVGLQTLNLKLCSNLVSLPNNIGCLSSLTELSLEGSSIVNLPKSIAHLSSLKSLNLSDCKRLECVPKLPPNLNQVLAFDCPSIQIMVLNSWSDFEEGTFKFHLTNSQKLDATSLSIIEEEACTKINDHLYLAE
ncbi:disease resistance protein RPV1-like [Trifolium pratense]|uniref:disease resistance protein RPV1-like n=1 Tax=Trifolium pratense TaxID=57577 RepID=UPI001E697733|nr:disease resistance protein RPV1-like [Trifolium pratense]